MTTQDGGDGGVDNGALLMRFADAVLTGSDEMLAGVRSEIVERVSLSANPQVEKRMDRSMTPFCPKTQPNSKFP